MTRQSEGTEVVATMTRLQEGGKPPMREYPIASADCHVTEPIDLYADLPPDVRDLMPRTKEVDGCLFFVADGLPPYPCLNEVPEGVWDDPVTTAIMAQREYRTSSMSACPSALPPRRKAC